VNRASGVNIDQGSAGEFERKLAKVLREILSRVSWLHGWNVQPFSRRAGDRRWDLKAVGPLPGGGRGVLCIEFKLHFQPSQFSSLVDRSCDGDHYKSASRVLAMPHVSPRMAALCEEHGWSWFDLAGNCRLEIPGVLFIERSGNEPVRILQRSGANLSTPEAGRIIRALLAPENAGQRWTQRGVVAHFGELGVPIPPPSLALVNKVVQHLRAEAFLDLLPNGGFRVRDPEGLLRAWRDAYRFNRHMRRRYFTLLQGHALQEKLRALDPEAQGRVAYAVFSAADFQAPHVRQPRTWLYLAPNVEAEFQAALEAKLVDSGENLVVLIPDDYGVFYRTESAKTRLACTNAVQTYVDVVHAGGRGEEAAEAILQQRLRPVWSVVLQ